MQSTVDTNSLFIGYEASRDSSVPQATVLTNATAIGYLATVAASNSMVLGGTGANAVNVGIGTTSPSAILAVSNSATTPVNTPLFTIASTTGGTATSTLMTVLANGNTGIGTSSPNFKLDVNGIVNASALYVGGSPYIGSQWTTNGSDISYAAGKVGIGTTSPFAQFSLAGSAGGATNLFAISTSTAGFATTTAATIDSNGNLALLNGANLSVGGTSSLTGLAAFAGGFLANASSTITSGLFSMNGGASTTQLTTTGNTYLATLGGNVGIGTTTPGSLLSLGNTGGINFSLATSTFSTTGGINLTSGCFAVNGVCAGTGSGGVGSGTQGQLAFYNAAGTNLVATSSLTLSQAGYFGIGTTTPNWNLQVAGVRPTFALTDTSAGVNLKHWLFSSMGGNLYIGTSTDAYGTSTPSALTVLNNGNVGIGTSTPFTTLGVVGNQRIKTTTNMDNAFTVENASATSTLAVSTLDSSSNIFSVASSTGQSFFEIMAGGNVGIGTTSPETTLTVVGAICAARSSQTTACGTTQGAIYANSSSLTGGYDVAEMYPTSDPTLGAGEVVSFDTVNAGSVARAATSTAPFLGIVSTSPGLTLGSLSGTALPLTLAGRVPTKVSAANGPIAAGDRLALSSTTPGVAVKALHSGETIGVALASYSGAGTGSVDVFVSPQYWLAPGDITIDPTSGMVGIGTTTPNHTLTVAGDVGAIAFVNTSTRTAKDDISYVAATTTADMFDQLTQLKVATYRYKIEDQSDPLRLGFLAEDLQTVAPEVLSPDGKGVDLYKLATFTLSGVQTLAAKVSAQDVRLTSLEARVTALESGSVSSASGSPLALGTTSLASALSSVGVLIQKGIAQFNTLVFRQLVASTDSSGTSSAGSVTLLAGNTTAQVNNALVLPTTKVFVTFNSQITGSWWVSDKTTGSFRVVLSAPQTSDVSFDYFLVQTEGQIATSTPDGSFPSVAQSSGPDTVPPTITLLGDNPLHLSVGSTFVEPGVTVTDNVDGTDPIVTFIDGTQQVVSSTTINTSAPTTYLITYSATDAAGNNATAMRSVIVGNPDGTVTITGSGTGGSGTQASSTPPTVTLNGSAAMQLTIGTAFTDPGATAVDATGNNLTSAIVETGTVSTTTIGSYTLTYSATDAAGNTGSASRLVNVVAASSTLVVVADTTAPVVTLSGAATMSLTQGSTFTDPGATATDNVDGDLTAKIVETGAVDAATIGSYTLTYSATDAAGNTGSASRAVTVVAPVTSSTTTATTTSSS